MISAIVLAAGEARRMGANKLLLPWGERSVLREVLHQLARSRVDEVILVVGHEADRVRGHAAGEGIKIVHNPEYREGMAASIRHGLLAVDREAEAFLVVLGDQPGISSPVIDALIDAFHKNYPAKKIIAPAHRGVRGNPVLFAASFRSQALGIHGDSGLRRILADHPRELLTVEVASEAVLRDLDTPEQYATQAGGKPRTSLARALEIGKGEVVGLVGAGGKTTLMYALGKELSLGRKGVLLTTTTKIWEPAPSSGLTLLLADDEAHMKDLVAGHLGNDRVLLLARARLESGKLAGIDPAWVEKIMALEGVSMILVEADGAAGRSLKAPREGEPVLPCAATLIVPLAGMDVLCRPLDEDHVFRAPIAARILGQEIGSPVTEEDTARLLLELLRSVPPQARVVPFLNKVDPGRLDQAREVARHLFRFGPGIHRVVCGEARSGAVLEIFVR